MSRRNLEERPQPGPEQQPRWSQTQKKAAALAAGIVAVLILSGAVYSVVDGPFSSGAASPSPGGPLRAVIVDQLSLTAPNPNFAETATETLKDGGYTVDYFPGEEVTVDFYRGLAARGYDLVLLRTHSARLKQEWQGQTLDQVVLFTGEPYSEKEYIYEQQQGQLAIARYFDDSEPLFGIAPEFIRSGMPGSFDRSTVVVMGCEGLGSEETAQSFVGKGAKTVIGWDGLVSAAFTDAATGDLIDLLVRQDLPPAEAVATTMADLGPDPTYGSELRLLE